MGNILYLILWVLVLYLFVSFFVVFLYVVKAINSAKSCKKYTRKLDAPAIAFFGDSTGYGVGATNAKKTLPGLIAEANPNFSIVNKCKSGAKIKDVIKVIQKHDKVDILITCCGGIDILKLSKYENIKKDIHDLFQEMNNKSLNCVFISPVNLGFSLAFPWFLRIFYWKRSWDVGLMIKKESKKFKNIQVINNLLLKSLKKVPNYKKISSSDRIHPNDDGYAWTFRNLGKKIKIQKLNFKNN
jgi:lysophospholipase L1-like esterase